MKERAFSFTIILHLPFIDSFEYSEEHISIVDHRVMAEVLLIVREVFEYPELEYNCLSMVLETNNEKLIFTSESCIVSSGSELSDFLDYF